MVGIRHVDKAGTIFKKKPYKAVSKENIHLSVFPSLKSGKQNHG